MNKKFLLKIVSVILLLGILVGVVACERNTRKPEDVLGEYTLARVKFEYNGEEISHNVNEIDKIENEKHKQLVQEIFDVYSKNKLVISKTDGQIKMAAYKLANDGKWFTMYQNFPTIDVPDIEGNAYHVNHERGALDEFFNGGGRIVSSYIPIYYRNGEYEFSPIVLNDLKYFEGKINKAGVDWVSAIFVRIDSQITE